MAEQIGGPISAPKPAQVSEEEWLRAAASYEQAVKSGAFDLVGGGAGLAVGKAVLNPRTVNEFKALVRHLVSNPQATKEQMKNLLLYAESWGHSVDKFRQVAGRLYPWN